MMDKSAYRSIGAMDTWEPPDKSFSKHSFKPGQGDLTPNEGSVCLVHINIVGDHKATEADLGNYKIDENVEVTIGEGDTLLSELLDKVLMSMKEGELCYIKSKVDIEGNKLDELELKEKSMKFNVALSSFSRAADIAELEQDERLERAQHHKDKGTELFQANRVEFAIKRYTRAVESLEGIGCMDGLPPSLRDQFATLSCQCQLNLAACFLKQKAFDQVVQSCDRALAMQPQSVKGLFRRAQALGELHKYETAMEDLNLARKLEPDNKAVVNQIRTVQGLIQKEKDMYKKMFN